MILTSDNLDEYHDPVLYDLENPDFEPEGPFYLDMARELGGPVLELGCGPDRSPLANDSRFLVYICEGKYAQSQKF